MFFRPSFCANCGDKIDRAEWGIFTSRRFCQVCESEFKGHDLLPRFIIGLGVLIGVLGVGGYLKSGSGPSDSQLIKQSRKVVDQPVAAQQNPLKEQPGNASAAAPALSLQNQAPAPARNIEARIRDVQKPPNVQAEPAVDLYYCGARTAKGTPCKHRVKGNVRCFQHVGMQAMLPPDQLRIR
jgi:hypothetical protein